MHLTDEQILHIFRHCDFRDLHEYNWWEQVFEQMDVSKENIDELGEVWTATGATKLVIGFKHWDWIIKIPFKCFGEQEEERYETADGEEKYRYRYIASEYFYAAENSLNDWDYCLREVEVYKEACSAGVDQYFAEIRQINDSMNSPIYVQKRVREKSDYYHKLRRKEGGDYFEYVFSEDEEKTISSVTDSYSVSEDIDPAILAEIIKEEGLDQIVRLLVCLEAQNVADLHNGNMGRENDRIMLFDYSGYREDY